jgi:hypothetical protein
VLIPGALVPITRGNPLPLELSVPVLRRPRSARLLVLVVSVTALVPLLLPPPAEAEEEVGSGDVVVGELVQAWPEHAGAEEAGEHADDGPLTWVETDGGQAVLLAAGEAALADLPVGATVEVVVGDEVPDPSPAEGGGQPAREVLEASVLAAAPPDPVVAAAGTAPTHQVTVVMAVPAGGTRDATTLDAVAGVVDGPVAGFWSGQSDGAIRLGVTGRRDWFQASAGCSDPLALWHEAAVAAGWTPGPGRHLLVYVSRASAGECPDGLAEVGRSVGSGGRSYVRSTSAPVIAHELGHNFGLGHSSAFQCDGAVEGPAATCRTAPYRDLYDVMGASWEQAGSLAAPQAAQLGLLPGGEHVTVGAASPPVAVALAPVAAAGGTRAVQLIDAEGVAYWLEYRAPVGQDAWLGTAANVFGLQAGVVLRRAVAGPDTSLLLDGTPSPRWAWDADVRSVLLPGSAVQVSDGDFSVTVRSVGATATVEIGTRQQGPAPSGDGGVGGRGAVYYLNDRFSGVANTVLRYGDPADQVYVGDWDGDRRDSLVIRRGNTFLVRNSTTSGSAESSFAYGDPGDTVLVGDWDGDGVDTLAVRRGNTFFVKNDLRTGVADVVFVYGDPGDTVLVGDWDGDRADTLVVRRGATYYVKNDTRTGVAHSVFVYGDPGDVVLSGRWSAGQGGDTLAVRRGNLYLLRFSLTSGVADLPVAYGEPSDTAFGGDWDGDGVDTLGVRRDAG